jgi:hypothetical protein
MKHVQPVVLAAIMLLLPGCATVAPEPRANQLGVELHSAAPADGLEASLAACAGGASARYVSDARSAANSWIEVVRTIDQCNIDAARYYTGAETMSRIIRPLDNLARAGTPECRQDATALRERIVATNTEIVQLIGTLASLCQTTDSLADIELQRARLRQRRADVCQRIDRAVGGSKRGGC